MKTILISIPAYNEEGSLGSVIHEIKQVMDKTNYKYSVQVVDDGSKDQTNEVAKKAGAKVTSHQYNAGLAETFRTEIKEFLKTKADIFVHIDADGQYRAVDIPLLVREVEAGNDLVLGDRFKGGIESMPWLKKLGNRMFSRTISKIVRYKVNDCQTGFRAFNRKVAEGIKIISTHTYTQEQIIKAVKANYKIKEVPAPFVVRKHGSSRLLKNPFEYAIRAWINIFRIYRDYDPLKFFGRIGFFFMGLGLVVGIWLLSLFIKTGKVGHMPATILTGILIITGIQIIVFGFLAEMQKRN